MFLLTTSAQVLLAFCILGNWSILVFWAFFGSLLKHILNDFKNSLDWFLMFWAFF